MTGVRRMTVAETFAEIQAERGVLDEAAVAEANRRFAEYFRLDEAIQNRETSRVPDNPKHRGPGDVGDAMDREDRQVLSFTQQVGRPPSPAERVGPPVAGCIGCAREASVACADHARKPGDPLLLPPQSQWFTGRVAGAPYDLMRSVAG